MMIHGKLIGEEGVVLKGKHKINSKGEIIRTDMVQTEMSYDVAVNQDELMLEEAIRRFKVDAEELGLLIHVKDENGYYRYLDENEELDMLKVYYYGKDLREAFRCQDVAIKCLEYVNMYEQEYKDFALNYIYKYLSLREDPLTNMWELEELEDSQEMKRIYWTVDYR